MSHFAKVENGTVTNVITAEQDFIDSGAVGPSTDWVQTSYNTYAGEHKTGGTPLRKNYAGIGYTYDKERDAFYAPQPFESWSLNEDTCIWEAPTPMPSDVGTGTPPKMYVWNEDNLDWEVVTF